MRRRRGWGFKSQQLFLFRAGAPSTFTIFKFTFDGKRKNGLADFNEKPWIEKTSLFKDFCFEKDFTLRKLYLTLVSAKFSNFMSK